MRAPRCVAAPSRPQQPGPASSHAVKRRPAHPGWALRVSAHRWQAFGCCARRAQEAVRGWGGAGQARPPPPPPPPCTLRRLPATPHRRAQAPLPPSPSASQPRKGRGGRGHGVEAAKAAAGGVILCAGRRERWELPDEVAEWRGLGGAARGGRQRAGWGGGCSRGARERRPARSLPPPDPPLEPGQPAWLGSFARACAGGPAAEPTCRSSADHARGQARRACRRPQGSQRAGRVAGGMRGGEGNERTESEVVLEGRVMRSGGGGGGGGGGFGARPPPPPPPHLQLPH